MVNVANIIVVKSVEQLVVMENQLVIIGIESILVEDVFEKEADFVLIIIDSVLILSKELNEVINHEIGEESGLVQYPHEYYECVLDEVYKGGGVLLPEVGGLVDRIVLDDFEVGVVQVVFTLLEQQFYLVVDRQLEQGVEVDAAEVVD